MVFHFFLISMHAEFELSAVQLQFSPFSTQELATFIPVDDAIVEGPESVTLSWNSPDSAADLTITDFTVTILDANNCKSIFCFACILIMVIVSKLK